ncbi:hypothetical protein [Thiolapillus sp.]
MQATIGFCNIAVHNHQQMSLPILQSILENHLTDFKDFARLVMQVENQ